ncbi:tracheal-prostasin [Carabus blaptoides fortunei]
MAHAFTLGLLLISVVCAVNSLPPKRYANCECGLNNNVQNRIAGGWETKPHELPWVVAIHNKRKLFCGGAIINDRYILTAGHCVRWNKRAQLSVVVGQHNRRAHDGIELPIRRMILHKEFYSHKTHDETDIALIKLAEPIEFSNIVTPVCLPKEQALYDNEFGTVAGWGMKQFNTTTVDILRQTFVKVLSKNDCRNTPMRPYINSRVLCAYFDNTDACQGDSGGPLTYEREPGKSEIIGVVSWGVGCATPKMPGIYTSVVPFLEWIYRNTADAVWCKEN